MARTTLFVVSHTHWDREWYESFQKFRWRLVRMIDDLVEHMEADPEYRYFHLDGQTVVLDDYLAIRPENRQRLTNLIQSGRIIVGPWYVMPDEFLLCGESLVRNLQKGFAIARSYGVEPLKCGYVVDIFGHNSQFPQVLRGFGINSAILYRGAADYPKDTFTWSSPDGSKVLCMKMDAERSYSNFYFAIRRPFDDRDYEPVEVVRRMRELLDYSKSQAVSANLLMLDGVDHIAIEPQLPHVLDIINQNMPDVDIRHATLAQYVAAQQATCPTLEEISGELYAVGRRGVNNAVLKNVLSSMVHLKQFNDRCETLLTRWAEPLDAFAGLFGPRNTQAFFDMAWKCLMQNHPHDSICGCSMTNVHQDNEYRFRQTLDIADELIESAVTDIEARIDTRCGKPSSLVLFNPSQVEIRGIVQAEIELPRGTEANFRLFTSDGQEVPYQVLDVRTNDFRRVLNFRQLHQHLKIDFHRITFHAVVPPLGYSTLGYEQYTTVEPAKGDYTYKQYHAPTRYLGSMQTDTRTWENAFLRIDLTDGGTLGVTHKAAGRRYDDIPTFEDCGDAGDGWNYRSPQLDRRCLSTGGRADAAVEADGPLAVTWRLTHHMEIPASLDAGKLRRAGQTIRMDVVTHVTMHKDSARLDFRTVVNNSAVDHRLRVLFPTRMAADTFHTSTPFYFQNRPVKQADWSDSKEPQTGVYPNQGVVLLADTAGSLALYNRGLYEVAVAEDAGRAIALTLFRSVNTDWFPTAEPMGYLKRTLTFEYALEFGPAHRTLGDVLAAGEAWRAGLRWYTGRPHEGDLPSCGSFLKLTTGGASLSCVKAGANGTTVVRLFNCQRTVWKGSLQTMLPLKNAKLLDLNEQPIADLPCHDKEVPLEISAGGIVTVGLKLHSGKM